MKKFLKILYCIKRGVDKTNKFLTTIWNNKEVRWEIGIIIVSAGCSALCAAITKDMILTVIYIGITALIDIISEIESKMEGLIDWEKIIGGIFKIKRWIKYVVCVGLAVLPTLLGVGLKEVAFSGIKDIPSIFFVNIFPNVCGALIVCSLIAHISKLDEKQFVSALTQAKRSLFNIIIRIGFFACYLNAVNYKADDSWKWANLANSLYLFFIIFIGAVAVVSFLSRFIDNRPFPYTSGEVFPTSTLFYSTLFLFSCCVAPLIAKVGKHEPLLLFFNTITTGFIFGWLLWFIGRRANQKDKYPIVQFVSFMTIDLVICFFSFSNWNETRDIMGQIMSGGLILGAANIILLYLNHLRIKNLKLQQEDG